MDPDFQQEMQRLQQYRESFAEYQRANALTSYGGSESSSSGSQMNHSGSGRVATANDRFISISSNEPVQDPLIYPGLYSPSGFDLMGILVRVRMRPNPVIDIGNIDGSVALVLCDTSLPDMPVVYCSEYFEKLTGYSSLEILGRNCRFLQHPHRRQIPNGVQGGSLEQMVQDLNAEARIMLKNSFEMGGEAQVRLVNYKKSGEKFSNLLTTIPITWEEGERTAGPGKRYIVGFQADSLDLLGF